MKVVLGALVLFCPLVAWPCLDHSRACGGAAKSISWTFGSEVPLPEVLSGLSVSPARRGRVDVADGASCVTVIDASWATIDLTPGGLDPRWEPYVEKTLRIDGEVWARRIPASRSNRRTARSTSP
jgi:hypothetical protein